MAYVVGQSYGIKFAEAVGLDTKNLHSFTLEVKPDDLILIRAVYVLHEEGAEGLKEIMKSFKLEPHAD